MELVNENVFEIDFEQEPCKYWEDYIKIGYLQRRIIVYSIMYYELNESCISDKQYDIICRQLIQLQRSVDLEEFKRSEYYYAMHDYDGSTGFDLYYRLTDRDREYLTRVAMAVLSSYKSGK